MNETKVLIIGHNVLDRRTAFGKTLISFFESWGSENLAELYFHSEVPTVDIVSRYYRITDTDALKSIFQSRKKSVGRSFDITQIDSKRDSSRTDTGLKHKIYSFGRKRTSGIYIARNSVWRLSKWYSPELRAWIHDFAPDVIFFVAGDYAFAYDIAYTISRDFHVPIVTYCCDDFYINRMNPDSVLSNPVYNHLMKKVHRCISYSKSIVTICDKMTEAYKTLFDKPIYTVYTGSSTKGEPYVDSEGIVYLGNLGLARHESLIDIGRALKRISEKTGENLHLDVYSSESRYEILRELTEENGIIFHGAVSSEEVKKIIAKSKLVIHVESFAPENVRKVEYSISTKIADLLASGRCIFAYGPKSAASFEYLAENDAACVVTDRNMLEKELESILTDRNKRKEIVKAAAHLAERNHEAKKVAVQILGIIQEV